MSNTLPENAAAAEPAENEQLSLKVFTTSTALALLWEKSCQQMTTEELEWFADGASEQVAMEARTLSAVLEGTACLLLQDKRSGAFQDTASGSMLLFNLQNQLDTITGLADIAAQANYDVRRALKGGPI